MTRLPLMDANSDNPLEASIARLRHETREYDSGYRDGYEGLSYLTEEPAAYKRGWVAGNAQVWDDYYARQAAGKGTQ